MTGTRRALRPLAAPPALCAVALAACAPVGPDYVAPVAALPPAYADPAAGQGGAASPAPPAQVTGRAWWLDYGDPLL
ncbi:MAG: hypothetical protein VX463_10185, partial [Pseudomonadota bacterium]|nr:hypothetical protein [Pseudomonadota bacterium]